MDEASVKQIVKSNNDELMSSISELISSQISSLKRSAEEVSPNQILREIKKIKTSNRPSFNRKSNEEQYKSATQILDTLEEANFNLEESNIPGRIQAKVVVFGQKKLYSGKVVVIGQKLFYTGKIGYIRAKWLYSGKIGCIRGKVDVFFQSACIWAKVVVL